ncbi:MAG TPA: hypothetical protein VKT77_05455 [Chthonomonadaceae bacterium]|nr:hypothetical protein [Chthonomonadaceae bacterium]
MQTLHRTIWIISALAIAGMTVLFATQPGSAVAVGETKRFTTADRSIAIDHPANWKPRSRSVQAVETEVEFNPSHDAFLSVDANLQGSLMADMLKSANSENSRIASMVPGGEALNPHQLSPLEHLHAVRAAHMKDLPAEYPGFTDGETAREQVAGHEALVSNCTWMSAGLFGGQPMVGRRVTILSGDHEVSVVYGCPRAKQKDYLPVFDRMLRSLALDVPGGPQ